ncbi:DUF4438 domain-containing protein [Alphaproteobacteria bacterium]|jgi:hypothetical protein|nr:DUF4438 domain-containing protein [Alphaproteobacteria bacterium]
MITNLKTNEKKLIKMSIGGYVTQPSFKNPGYIPDNDGNSVILPGMYGVVNNVKVGDKAFGWNGDHIEPGVSIDSENVNEHFALHYLVCTGNKAIVRSGEAKGKTGIVTGEHARNLIHFEQNILEKICVGDQIDIITHGRGLKLLDFPEIEIKKIDPNLFKSMNFKVENKKLIVDVAIELPIKIMGSGAELNSEYVDQDLMSGDRSLMKKLKIDQMKLGDLIVINHADHRWGRSYKKDHVSIALCIHGDSVMTGHGPGIMTIMTGTKKNLGWRINKKANLKNILKIKL